MPSNKWFRFLFRWYAIMKLGSTIISFLSFPVHLHLILYRFFSYINWPLYPYHLRSNRTYFVLHLIYPLPATHEVPAVQPGSSNRTLRRAWGALIQTQSTSSRLPSSRLQPWRIQMRPHASHALAGKLGVCKRRPSSARSSSSDLILKIRVCEAETIRLASEICKLIHLILHLRHQLSAEKPGNPRATCLIYGSLASCIEQMDACWMLVASPQLALDL